MFDFDNLETNSKKKYWYILHIPSGQPVYLPFKRKYERQTFLLTDMDDIDDCSYWIEDVVHKLLRKLVKDQGLCYNDFKIVEYEE